MSFWEISVLVVIAGSGIAGLLQISKAIRELGSGIFAIEAELKSINARAAAGAAGKGTPANPVEPHDNDLKAIETAISNFERMKRIDSAKS